MLDLVLQKQIAATPDNEPSDLKQPTLEKLVVPMRETETAHFSLELSPSNLSGVTDRLLDVTEKKHQSNFSPAKVSHSLHNLPS